MHHKLKEILEQKNREVNLLKIEGLPECSFDLPDLRDFRTAISVPGRINLISEIKFASPSAGIICDTRDPVETGMEYDKSGAAAISLLTDKMFFSGDINNLPALKRAVSIPILRKDFIIDEIQLHEAKQFGADAVLLIARILKREELKKLIETCGKLGLAALTEIHDKEDLEKALECNANIIGINNRDLDTFEIDINTTNRLIPHIPEGCLAVSESGFSSPDDIIKLKGKGINAVLVGSALMSSKDPAGKVRELVEAGAGSGLDF